MNKKEQEALKLAVDIISINDVLNDAAYESIRYQAHTDYEFRRKEALQKVMKVRDLAEEVLERESQISSGNGD